MFSEDYKNFLLQSIPTARIAGSGEILCRCQECPDSRDYRNAHMYISIPKDENSISYFYCHKCHCSGVVTHRTLIKWGIYNDAIAGELIRHNIIAFKNPLNKKYDTRIVYKLRNSRITVDDISYAKLSYVNDRLGLSLNFREALSKKLVLNINDVLGENGISEYTRHGTIITQLNDHYLGFISLDNAFINLRKFDNAEVYKSIDRRYINYNIFDKQDNTERFYTMPNVIDLSLPRRIQIHIAEGPFDVLSVYYNLRRDDNCIYTAVSGSGYKGLLKHFINVMKLPYLEVHIYPDNDKYGDRHVMEDIAGFLKPVGIPLYVHRNLYPGEKDFGVRLDHIKESIERMV